MINDESLFPVIISPKQQPAILTLPYNGHWKYFKVIIQKACTDILQDNAKGLKAIKSHLKAIFGEGIVVQQVKPALRTPAAHIRVLFQVPATLLLI